MTEPPLPEESIFARAQEITSDAERAAFLDRACGDDPTLRAEVEALLRADDRAGDLLDLPEGPATGLGPPADRPDTPGATAPDGAAREAAGAIVADRYRLLEPIGEGGMGTVYMAEQRQPVKRLVALKLIKPGMDSRAVLARFEAERQALAMMDHPHIARILDGGTTREQPGGVGPGRPYFVMELVKGRPLTEYCDARRLSIKDRLELFVPICSAVQHAHQKGIIHRDLKPTNILVTEHDGHPVPKVIDFGLAKALGGAGALTDRTLYTAFGTVVGTPLYMAPEQVGINALDVDTRSDVYALGVILYELLTGTTPLERRRLKEAAWEEVRRVIQEEEPPRPSVRLSSSEALPSLAAVRQTEPVRLARTVRGDLDWIVMKALEKDRARRYETANGLARDLQRYLADEPVTACPPSAGYRLRKFARRNRMALLIAGLIAAGLLIAMGMLVVSNRLISAEKGKTEQERNRAQRALEEARTEANRATAISDFLREMLGSADPENAKGSDYTVRQLLDEFAGRMGDQLRDQPEVEAAVRLTIGNAYRRLGMHDEAERQLRTALDLRRQIYGAEHPTVAQTLLDYAWVLAAKDQNDQWIEAVARAREALAIYRRQHVPARDMIRALSGLHHFLNGARRFDEAEGTGREALALARAGAPAHDAEVANILHHSAQAKNFQAQYAEAESLAREATALHRRLHGPEHTETGWALLTLGCALRGLGRDDDAEAALREALDIFRKYHGPEHKSVATATHELISVLKVRGDQAGLEALYQENLAQANRKVEQQPSAPETWLGLAQAHADQGRWDEALAACAKAVELNPRIHGAWLHRGRAHLALRQWDQAVADCSKAMELNPKGDVEWFDRGEAHMGLRQWDQAIADYSGAIERNPHWASAWANRGRARKELGRWAEAAADYAKAAELAYGPQRSFFRSLRGVCLARAGNVDQATRDADDVAREGNALALYNAACIYAVAAGHKDRAGGPEAAEARARRAVELLRQAVAAGYKDLLWLIDDADLDAVRGRADVRELLADLEATAPPLVQARYHMRLSRWDKAAAAFARADWARPLDDDAFTYACLFLIRGDSEGYNRFCQGMIERAAESKDPYEAYVLARSGAMARKSPVDPARLIRWAERASTGKSSPWRRHTLGLAHYRAGQFDQALQRLTEASVPSWPDSDVTGFGLALVHHRLGHPDEARRCLDKGIQWLKRQGPPSPGRPAKLPPQNWLEAQLLRREAEVMLRIKRGP